MDVAVSFSVLEIEKTKDRDAIRNAYRRLLVTANPEDDPEGFKRLREAYETADAFASKPEEAKKEPRTPAELWMAEVEACYLSLSSRLNTENWKKLLSDEICIALDTGIEARDALLGFLASHYRLKAEVWRLIEDTFQIQEDAEELREKFPPNFIDFILHQCRNGEDFPFEWFEGEDTADYDTFLYHYYELCGQNDRRDAEGARRTLETLEALPIFHPYLELEKARLEKCEGGAKRTAERVSVLLSGHKEDIRTLVFGGEIFWEAEEREKAAECFEKVLKSFPKHYMANKYLAKYCLEKGEPERGKEYCVEAMRVSAQEEELLACMRELNTQLISLYEERLRTGQAEEKDILELGWCFLQNDRASEGAALLEGRSMSAVRRAEYHNLLSKCCFMMEQYERAVSEAKETLNHIEEEAAAREAEAKEEEKGKEREKIPARTAGAYEMTARAYHALAQQKKESGEKALFYEKAQEAIEKALEYMPEERDYLAEKAQILLDKEEYEEAQAACGKMLELDSGDFYAWILHQKAAFELHDGQTVVDDFYRAKEIFAGYARIYELAAEVFIQYNQYEDARGILNQAEEGGVSSPKLSVLDLTIGREDAENDGEYQAILKKAGELEKEFEKHSEEIPDENRAELYYEKARCFRELDRQREALKNIEKAIELSGEKHYRWIRANTLMDLKEYDRALEDYLFCEKAYSENEVACESLAVCYERLENWRKAVFFYKKTAKLNPENERVNGAAAALLRERLENTGDLELYRQAKPFADRQAELTQTAYDYIERGLLYMEAGVWKEAETDFEKAVELEPDNLYVYNNLGCVYKYCGQYEKALAFFEKAIEATKEKDSLIAYGNAGDVCERMGDFKKAEQFYRRGLRRSPDSRWLRRSLYQLLKKMRSFEQAFSELEALYQKESPQYVIELGRLYMARQEYGKAFEQFRSAAERNDAGVRHKAEAARLCGDVLHYYKGKTGKALEFYKKALELIPDEAEEYLTCCMKVMECLYETGRQQEALLYQKKGFDSVAARYGSTERYLADYYRQRSHYYNIGALYFYAGEKEKARQYFDRIEECARCRYCVYQQCEDFWEAKGMLLESDGELELALSCYQRACMGSGENHKSICRVNALTKKLQKKSLFGRKKN